MVKGVFIANLWSARPVSLYYGQVIFPHSFPQFLSLGVHKRTMNLPTLAELGRVPFSQKK